MTEYTLVFRRVVGAQAQAQSGGHAWIAVRPALPGSSGVIAEPGEPAGMAQVFVVPIVSALGLDGIAYEHFLIESAVVQHALALLDGSALEHAEAVDTARKEVQALVMAAEVQRIVDSMPA